MAKTRSMSRSQNDDDAPNRKRFKTSDDGGWSDLTNDVLFSVMMQLGVVDFVGFSGVCKSWRCFAHSNRNRFMASRPPLMMRINNEYCLDDLKGTRFKPLFPSAAGMSCTGLTCGYMVFLRETTKTDFLLVNLITRHELYFPLRPVPIGNLIERVRAILVFSRSLSGWVLVMANRLFFTIWFSIAGTGAWSYVSSDFPILDIHAFKGKIYTLHTGGSLYYDGWRLCEMSLTPNPILTLLQIKNSLKPRIFAREFASTGDNLYVIYHTPENLYGVQELDVDKMEWMLPKEEEEEYAFFLSELKSGAAINGATLKLESPRCSVKRIYDFSTNTAQRSRKARLFTTQDVWYFPHECMNVDYIDG